MDDGNAKRPDRRPPADQPERTARGRLTPEVQNVLGHHLRSMYSEVISEGVPDRFAKLLDDLESGKNSKG